MDTILTQKSSGQWKEEEKALEIFINMSQASKLIFTVEAWLIFINMSQASKLIITVEAWLIFINMSQASTLSLLPVLQWRRGSYL